MCLHFRLSNSLLQLQGLSQTGFPLFSIALTELSSVDLSRDFQLPHCLAHCTWLSNPRVASLGLLPSMDQGAVPENTQPRRQPLSDVSNRVNMPTQPGRLTSEAPPPPSSPPIKQVRHSGPENACEAPQNWHPENKRVSAVIEKYQPDPKRNSVASTTSTASGKSRRKTHIGPWHLGKTLGKGSSGRVRLARHAVTGQLAAIKIMCKQGANLAQSSSVAKMDQPLDPKPASPANRVIPSAIEREIVIMKLLEHPNIMKLYDVWENRGELYVRPCNSPKGICVFQCW